ncbi:FecR family protein [Sphingobacterium siyangense]|uniref:FecR family protein n=1 Tax=Sphingobacterium siyangense TaxID=459529 RepID=UPI002FDEDB1E
MESKSELYNLFEKYLAAAITPTELQLLLDHFGAEKIDEHILAVIKKEMQQESENTADDYALVSEVKMQLDSKLYTPRKVKTFWRYVAVAAAIIIAIAIATLYYFQQNNQPSDTEHKTAQQTILPGSDKAILILSDGRKIELSQNSNETIVDNGGNASLLIKEGQVQYQVASNNKEANENAFNTISVPMGGQFKVVLPDGSIARLNAGSSLRYPVSFGITSRKMDLIGEGYFEAVKNKELPFTVSSANLEVTALGTQFNVNTYSNEPQAAATLAEGSLRVTNTKSQKTVIIKPGQQVYDAAGELKVRQVNIEAYTAWKDGLFVINKATLAEVLRQVERWYDVRVEGAIPNTKSTVSGEFPRDIALVDLLNSLESTTGIKTKIEGRRIVIR